MVRKPLEFIFPSCSFMIFVSGWRPSNSDQGLLFKFPRQSSLNFWFLTVFTRQCISEWEETRERINFYECWKMKGYLLNIFNAFQWDNPFLLKLLVTCSWAHELSTYYAFRSAPIIQQRKVQKKTPQLSNPKDIVASKLSISLYDALWWINALSK